MQQLSDAELDAELGVALQALDLERFDALGAEADRRRDVREARLSAPDALATAAVWYAQQGIAVFPLMPRDKKPFPGSRGFKDATTDVEQVRRWWTATPSANVGLPTGHLFDVIDIDGDTGARSYVELVTADVLPKVHGRVTTGRPCSQHLYIAATGDGNAAGVWPGIDYRGDGGYVVAPPSVTLRRYDWLVPLDLAALKAAV